MVVFFCSGLFVGKVRWAIMVLVSEINYASIRRPYLLRTL